MTSSDTESTENSTQTRVWPEASSDQAVENQRYSGLYVT